MALRGRNARNRTSSTRLTRVNAYDSPVPNSYEQITPNYIANIGYGPFWSPPMEPGRFAPFTSGDVGPHGPHPGAFIPTPVQGPPVPAVDIHAVAPPAFGPGTMPPGRLPAATFGTADDVYPEAILPMQGPPMPAIDIHALPPAIDPVTTGAVAAPAAAPAVSPAMVAEAAEDDSLGGLFARLLSGGPGRMPSGVHMSAKNRGATRGY